MTEFETQLSKSLGTTVVTPFAEHNVGGGFSLRAQSVTLPPVHYSDTESEDELDTIGREHSYRPLKANEIRLLILNPGKPDDPIECYLEHYPVNSAKPYQAISYVWGDAADPSSICVDGFDFEVTSNLKAFLASYRAEHRCHVLWIDAVSINQNDILERNSQIRLMKRVYEGAESVTIWLGNEREDTKLAFDYLKRVHRPTWRPLLDRLGWSDGPFSSIKPEDVPELVADDEEVSPRTLNGIRDVLERQWWTRIWVYQESTAPARNKSVVVCGSNLIQFEIILAYNRIIRQLDPDRGSTQAGVIMDVYSQLRRDYQDKGTSDYLRMADLLPTLRSFKATNARDKLYALIPTSLDGADLLDVDYSLSVENVYIGAAANIIQKYRNLDLLGHCTNLGEISSLNLPSWVPDWTSPSAPVHFFKRGETAEWVEEGPDFFARKAKIGKLYNASNGAEAEFRIDRTSGNLTCKGFIFDEVESVSPSSGDMYEGTEIITEWAAWLWSMSSPLSTEASSYPSGITTEEAFSRTLVADCDRIGVDVGVRIWKNEIGNVSSTSKMRQDIVRHFETTLGDGIRGLHPATLHRKLVLTKRKYIGLAPKHSQAGDIVTILLGGQVPFILRKSNNKYVLIGEAYVHGIMDGEVLTASNAVTYDFLIE